MKNLYVLPTDQPSKLSFDFDIKQYYLQNEFSFFDHQNLIENRNIYLTSDENLTLGGYHFNSKYGDEPQKTVQRDIDSRKYWEDEDYFISKIILTTDPELIKDGVQNIDAEFLKWFIKNLSCEEVEVKHITRDWNEFNKVIDYYKIIIPKEKLSTKLHIGEVVDESYPEAFRKEESKYPIGGYAPGNYNCHCITCKANFQGDKRAIQCEPCATTVGRTDYFYGFGRNESLLFGEFCRTLNSINKDIARNNPDASIGELFEIFKNRNNKHLEEVANKFKVPKEDPKCFDCQGTIKEGICFCNKEEADWSLEAAINFALSGFSNLEYRKGFVTHETISKLLKAGVETGYKFRAKWQAERMYSGAEVITILQKYRFDLSSGITPNLGDTTKKWFEQFKKK